MLTVFWRVIFKIFIFWITAIFIIFFIVYGFRYEKNIGFIQKNAYIKFKFWSDNNYIWINSQIYYIKNKEINLYNFDKGCYNIGFQNLTQIQCIDQNESFDDVYIQFIIHKSLTSELKYQKCEKIKPILYQKNCIKQFCFSKEIDNVFNFNNINFVSTNNKLYYCDDNFKKCKYLTNNTGEIICGNKNGLIGYNKEYYQLILQ